MEKQVLLIFAAANRYLDNVEVAACRKIRDASLYTFVDTNYGGLLKMIREKKAIDDSVKAEINEGARCVQGTLPGDSWKRLLQQSKSAR